MASSAVPVASCSIEEVCTELSRYSGKKLDQPIPLSPEVECLREIDLPAGFFFSAGVNYHGIELIRDAGEVRTYSAKFPGSPGSSFSWSVNFKKQEVSVEQMYRGALPTWIKVGEVSKWLSTEKGVPTAQLLTAQFCKDLRLDKERPRSLKKTAINAQTYLDIFYAVIVKEESIPEALVHSHTAKLASEFAVFCGAKQLKLNTGYIPAVSQLAISLEIMDEFARLPRDQQQKFNKQRKIVELKERGIDFLNPNLKFPQYLSLQFDLEYPPF